MAEQVSAFGEKLLDASCRTTVPPSSEGEATAEIWTNGLLIKPKTETTLYLPFVEALSIRPANYRIAIKTTKGKLTIAQLGLRFDAFAQRLVASWGDALARALL